jgi:PST family polysaccharide transporter
MPNAKIENSNETNGAIEVVDEKEKIAGESKSVSQLAKEGVFYNVIVRLGNTFTQFIGGVILVRLLEPNDFGILQLGWLIIGFATKFGEFGFNMGLIQRNQEVRSEHVNTLFVLDLSFKITLWIITVICTPWLASFFHEPMLSSFLPVFSFYMVLECFSTSPMTMLQRNMNFKAYSQVLAIDRTMQLIGALSFAALGFGVWSFVFGEFLGLAWSSIRAIQLSGWRPRLQFDREAGRELFGYGNWVFLRNLFRYLSDNIDYLIIGRVLDSQQLGYAAQTHHPGVERRRFSRVCQSAKSTA